ncbi:MAG: hypothetical protein ABIH37_01635 [archaeon]
MNLFRAKEEQMLWGEKPSDCVPEECWDYNDKPECRQYDKFKETKEDWDEYGNFIGTKNKCGKEGSTPTMQESIPECFDGDVFLEEKCGKITMVENEDGLVNYIVEKDVDGIIEEFENKSEQNTYAPGTTADGENGTINGGQIQVQSKAMQIKKDMNQITNQIAQRTYAPGTGPGGKGGVVVDGDNQGVVTGGGGNGNNVVDGDGGYAPGTSGDSPGNTVVDGGGNNVVTDDMTVDAGPVDSGGNDIAGVDEGPGEPGVVDED